MPIYIAKALEQPRKYSSKGLTILTPDNLKKFLPNFSTEKTPIKEIAHKADFIRSQILYSYGGLWLDCDSIIVRNIDCLFDDLNRFDMVTFTESGTLNPNGDPTLIQCLACKPGCRVIGDWVEAQRIRLAKPKPLKWIEIGANMLNEACLKGTFTKIKVRPANQIEPVKWQNWGQFHQEIEPASLIKEDTLMFMWFNKLNKTVTDNPKTLFNRLMLDYVI